MVTTTHPQAAPTRQQRLLILGICSTALLIVGLDTTIVNVALPSIHRSLNSSLSDLQWIVDAYTLVLASLQMLSGSMGDRFGRRKVFQCGLALFVLASLLCGLAPSLPWLVAFRGLQAIGGSMLGPVAMSIVRNVFEDPRERAQAIGVWGAMFGVSLALGPVLGGALVSGISWRAIFFVNVPVGFVAIALTILFVPESRAARPRRFDPLGQVLVIAALAWVTYAVIEIGRSGFSALVILLFGVSLCGFAALVTYELRREDPLLQVRFFRSPPFAGASATAVLLFTALGGFLFMTTLYLQDARSLSPVDAGLYLLPMAVTMIIFAPLSGTLVGRVGARPSLILGGIGVLAGALMLTSISPTTSVPLLLGAYVVFGLGLALANPPITNTAVSGMPPSQAGVAAAVATTSRQVGMTLGVAVLGTVAGAGIGGSIGHRFAADTRPGWWIIAALGLLIVVLGFWTTTASAQQRARLVGEQLGD